MLSSPPARRRSKTTLLQRKSSLFYRRSRTSAPVAPDPTLFLPPSPLCECRTLASHVDPRWLHGWFMISKKELLTRTMCMSVQDRCQAVSSSLCRHIAILWDFFGRLPINKQTRFSCERRLASLSWVFNPRERKKILVFLALRSKLKSSEVMQLGATRDGGTFF